ncbi:hypothetical protein GCM10010271_63330 [Streptomyces kurssanovii]|nr:hypothetical protein GCM10010271_63330 [Streptomyces kurssanovii]
MFFDVAYQASWVRLVDRDQSLRGNSALEGSRSAVQIGMLLSPALMALSLLTRVGRTLPAPPETPVPSA